jgi:hypothetical protein
MSMNRPLLICDADEVLVQFAAAFKNYLQERGWNLTFETFALHGNIRHIETGEPAAGRIVSTLLAGFFEDAVETCLPVPGAVNALAHLSQHADVIILTNVPDAQRARREKSLASLGMAYPVFSNEGPKGPRIAELIAGRAHPIAFVDDIPHHHASVAELANRVHRLHLVADPQLRTLLPKAPDAHARIDDWHEALPHLESVLLGI